MSNGLLFALVLKVRVLVLENGLLCLLNALQITVIDREAPVFDCFIETKLIVTPVSHDALN